MCGIILSAYGLFVTELVINMHNITNFSARMSSLCYTRRVRNLWAPALASWVLKAMIPHKPVCQLKKVMVLSSFSFTVKTFGRSCDLYHLVSDCVCAAWKMMETNDVGSEILKTIR